MTVSEPLKSHFIEKMHLLQGAWHRTTKSRADLIWILCGHLRPPPQREGVISFGPYRWPPSAPQQKAGVLSFAPYVAIMGPDAPPSVHSYRSDCRTVGTDPPKRVYIPLGRDTGCRTNAVQAPHTASRPNNPDGPSRSHTDMSPGHGGPIGEVYPILSVLTVALLAQALLTAILLRLRYEA